MLIKLDKETVDMLDYILVDIYDRGEDKLKELSYEDLIIKLIKNEMDIRSLT